MDRKVTNIIKFFMDECLPPIVRDTKWFMYPFFLYAYRGKNISRAMNIKSLIHSFSQEEYAEFYNSLDTISRNRETDLTQPIINEIISLLPEEECSVLDVGCGHGYLLSRILEAKPNLQLAGCDVKPPPNQDGFKFIHGSLTDLKLGAKSFDIVTCCHTLEHIVDIKTFIDELKSIARKKIIIVVPCQREFFYTLDEHINFFPYKAKLTSLIGCRRFQCKKIWGDWLFWGDIE